MSDERILNSRKYQAIIKIEGLKLEAKAKYGVDMSALKVLFNIRGQKTGEARRTAYGELTLRLNPSAMMTDEGWDHIFNNTIPHEMAHLVCFIDRRLGKDHDAGWCRVCVELGGNGEEFHTLALEPARKVRKFAYIATCGKVIVLTSIRHNKVQSGSSYRLNSTGGYVNNKCQYRQVA